MKRLLCDIACICVATIFTLCSAEADVPYKEFSSPSLIETPKHFDAPSDADNFASSEGQDVEDHGKLYWNLPKGCRCSGDACTVVCGHQAAGACKAGSRPSSPPMIMAQQASQHAETSKGIFLKNKYIELGINKDKGGMYGADYAGKLPAGFFARKAGKGIGMTGDSDGFGVGKDLRIDYFLPGTHEERWQTGYKLDGKAHVRFNYGTQFADTSHGQVAAAKITGKQDSNMQTTQEVTLHENSFFFRTKVLIKNTGSKHLHDVRYGRSCDPDNTVDLGGSYSTHNYIASTFAAGDKFAAVTASSKKGDEYSKLSGTEAVLTYASLDKRAVPAYGNSGLYPRNGVYNDEISNPHGKSKGKTKDAWIGIFAKLGDLAPGSSSTFIFDTWLTPATVKVDETAVTKAAQAGRPPHHHLVCLAVPCPAGSHGANVHSGCKCSKGGKITPSQRPPYYTGGCL